MHQNLFRKITIALIFAMTLFVMLSGTVFAQDTPQPVREAAIQDLNNRIPGIGRPNRWFHTLERSADGNLGCSLLPAQGQIPDTQVYVVTLDYDTNSYVYRVTPDASRVVACDAKLLSTQNGTPQFNPGGIDVQTGCDTVVQGSAQLSVGTLATVSQATAIFDSFEDGTRKLADLSAGMRVTILGGPNCRGTNLWWQVRDADNLIGYAPEFSFAGQAVERRFLTPAGALESATCPTEALAFSRLTVGMTAL
ncbi:MAG TPA: hypothetical protein VJZ27_16260, partial [Aggregatilineales bacterium]|nr:hypothetical protein [Aggregatilineales bacterium]